MQCFPNVFSRLFDRPLGNIHVLVVLASVSYSGLDSGVKLDMSSEVGTVWKVRVRMKHRSNTN